MTLLDLVDRHRDPSAFDRAETLSWTQAQVQLRHLGILTREGGWSISTLAGFILRNDARFAASTRAIASGLGPQSALWPLGISGDLPIVLLRIDDADDIASRSGRLTGHEYWQMRQFNVDLVILNERTSSYVQDLQIAIEGRDPHGRNRAPEHRSRTMPADGTVHALRADLSRPRRGQLLLGVAAVVLVASRGIIGQQIDALPAPAPTQPGPRHLSSHFPGMSSPDPLPLNQSSNSSTAPAASTATGANTSPSSEGGQTTPAPWINVIANPSFGFQVSAEGSGHIWSENSRENQLTPWSNDPVCDPVGRGDLSA